MIDPAHPLPIVRQAQLLELSRSSVYYRPQPTSDADLVLMRRLDGCDHKILRRHGSCLAHHVAFVRSVTVYGNEERGRGFDVVGYV